MGETLYTIGTDQQQAWMKKNCFPPRGYGYSEPGTYSLDATEVAAYNVAKSFLSSLSGSLEYRLYREGNRNQTR